MQRRGRRLSLWAVAAAVAAAGLPAALAFASQAAEGLSPSRTLTAVNVQFAVPAVSLTSIAAEPNLAKGAYGVYVHAGVTYPTFAILAASNLGVKPLTIRVKLVVFDIRSLQKECPDIEPFDWMPPPFNGQPIALTTWAMLPPEPDKNSFAGVSFPRAGDYRLCYTSGDAASDWYLLGDDKGPGIFVIGALSRFQAEEKVWCPLGPMQAVWQSEFLCLDNPTRRGCQCMGKITGRKRRSVAPYNFMLLGQPDPAVPQWRSWVTEMGKECGSPEAGSPDPNPLEVGALPKGYPGYVRVTNYQGYEVHNFGTIYNKEPSPATFDQGVGTWRLCYCSGLSMDGIGEVCDLTQQQDYPQTLGRLIIITTLTEEYQYTVYPTLRFTLYICCGSQECNKKNKGYGGCSEKVGTPRYKIVANSPTNDYMYFESESGCRTAGQLASYSATQKVIGGHLGPANCDGPANCKQLPFQPDGCSADAPCREQRTKPTFLEVQIDASYDNMQMMEAEVDVCYCDDVCDDPLNWFKAGNAIVKPMILEFQDLQAAFPTQTQLTYVETGSQLLLGSVVVNTPVWVVIRGSDRHGGWSSEASPDARYTREMKILRDECGRPDRPCEWKITCLQENQPNVISGHRLESGNTDYTAPVTLIGASLPRGQRWGSQCATPASPDAEPLCQPAIEISEPGWFAVCYCDSNCNEVANWLLVGRQLVAGPILGQTWRMYTETTFSINVQGWGLNDNNLLRLLSPNQDLTMCGGIDPLTGKEYAQTDRGHGPGGAPKGKAVIWSKGVAESAIADLSWDASGTMIMFNNKHGLQDGDRIKLDGLTITARSTDPWDSSIASKQEAMFGSVHEVTLGCDDVVTKCYKIIIPITFEAAEFPRITNPAGIVWYRNSEERFDNLRIRYGYPSSEGNGYRVCWSPQAGKPFVGQVGEIRVDDPQTMESRMGLTTVMAMDTTVPNRGAPGAVYFKTGGSARYQQADGPMHLFIALMPGQVGQYSKGDWSDVMEYMNFKHQKLDSSTVGSYVSWNSASQRFCGQVFLEMWSEDPSGFPMPDGCYYKEDKVHVGRPPVPEIHLRFGKRNGLKPNTVYMLVLNLNVIKYADWTRGLSTAFPDNGVIWVWSMDDYDANPYNVIELGQAKAGELDKRIPPATPDGKSLVLYTTSDDPRFDPSVGFKITDYNSSSDPSKYLELTAYCLPYSSNIPSPSKGKACLPCITEQDCGNGNEFTAPDVTVTWCQSPISTNCISKEGASLLDVPAFYFQLTAAPLAKIQRQNIVRLFMHPLTAWYVESCKVGWVTGGCIGVCDDPNCVVEAVIGGAPTGVGQEFPLNILKIQLPQKMGGYFSGNTSAKMKLGSINVPAGGILPDTVSAEILDANSAKPDYWPHYRPDGPAGFRLYVKPRVMAASMISSLGDGNQYPFKDESTSGGKYPANVLYVRLVFAATLFARTGDSISMTFTLPPNTGYECLPTDQLGLDVPALAINANSMPNGQGKMKGGYEMYRAVNPMRCRVPLLEGVALYARQSAYIALRVKNPRDPLKYDDPQNVWNVTITGSNADWFGSSGMFAVFGNSNLGQCQGTYQAKTRKRYLCLSKLKPGFDKAVSVLGKMSNFVMAPSNFGIGRKNTLSIFFRTMQMAGNLQIPRTELWVDAPSGFQFGQYCTGSHLEPFYYIPEGVGTTKLPIGGVFTCMGEPRMPKEQTFNRAKIKLSGRLLANTLYGVSINVTNPSVYMRNQQISVEAYIEPWALWTYQWKQDDYWGGDPVLNGVDGTFFTAKFNEEQLDYQAWGCFLDNLPRSNFGVTFADLTPTPPGTAPTEIRVMPIIVVVATRRAMRITAPSGFVWDFEQAEFRYKRRATGVPEGMILDGVEADMPLAGVPARPVSPPLNVLTVDYMQGAWAPGVKYGFACKIRIPYVPPTGSVNQFTIEFGYNEDLNENRLQAGVADLPLVKSLIMGGIEYETSIMNRSTIMIFSVQTVSFIPNAGGLLITGPPDFKFEPSCQPKPVDDYPDFPPDITCIFIEDSATGVPRVSVYAGGSGIPPAHYKFTLTAVNPPYKRTAELGQWVFQSFSQMSEQIVLDERTEIPGYMINERMGGPAEFGAVGGELRMPPYEKCTVVSDEVIAAYGVQKTQCDFEAWQFYPALGGSRDDRPNQPSSLAIKMILTNDVDGTYDLVVRAPKGYEFDTDCKVYTWPSAMVFDSQATWESIRAGRALWATAPETWQRIPVDSAKGPGVPLEQLVPPWRAVNARSFNQRYNIWPTPGAIGGGAELNSCKGNGNFAKINLKQGLKGGGKGYVFRISVLKNPPATPNPNLFVLEYGGEASEPFVGVTIWAFENITIVPTTTATSTASLDTWNTVTITFKPVNTLPNKGHLRVTAPAEFTVPTTCSIELKVHEDMNLNYTAMSVQDLQWSEFLPGDVPCQGDTTESSMARLLFTQKDKYLKAQIVYKLKITVRNPEVTSPYQDAWHLSSYKTTLPTDLLDDSEAPGFSINSVAEVFVFLQPSSYNAKAVQRVDFQMSFPSKVELGDRVEVVAPLTYYFSELGSSECPQYQYLQGSLRRTRPKCGGNTMWWILEEETMPAEDVVRFLVQLKNPLDTPDINLFQVRQLKPDGTRRASRMVPGYIIVPETRNVSITRATDFPLGQCRSDVPIQASFPCRGVGSYTSLLFQFNPTKSAVLLAVQANVEGDPFDFTQAMWQLPLGTKQIPLARSATMLLSRVVLYANTRFTIRVDKVVQPKTQGTAMFDVTTFTDVFDPLPTVMPSLPCSIDNGMCGTFPPDTARRDESLSFPAFEVLGYIAVSSLSRIDPIYYSAIGGTVTILMRSTVALMKTNVLRITRAEGYKLAEGSLLGLKVIKFKDGQHGLDVERVWSASFSDVDDYWGELDQDIPADATFTFSFKADLPTLAFPAPFWTFQTYQILPEFDVDGEVLNATMPYYPWPGRGRVNFATNDGAKPDFLLVGPVDFTVTPQQQTPGAYTQITFVFDVAQEIAAAVERTVTMQVTGPEGFVFADKCFGSPINPAFSKCTGYRNTATLNTIQPRLRGAGIIIILLAFNPRITPSPNYWNCAIFTDDPSQYVRWSEELSYDIAGMPVVFKGNNQLGESASGFFTFSPIRPSPSPLVYLIVTPPPNAGFRLFCTGFSPLGFVTMPQCTSGGVNEAVTLMFQNATLMKGQVYTFGITVYNPGGAPNPATNYWGLEIRDYNFATFNSNLDIPGLDLGTMPIRCYGIGWRTTAPRLMNKVMIQIRVLHEIAPSMLTTLNIIAPNGIMFSEDKSTLNVIPTPLPLVAGNKATIAGDTLILNIDPQQAIGGDTVYNIYFEVINPVVYPHDNTWGLLAKKNIDVEFSHWLTGYVSGQVSPYDLTVTRTKVGTGAAHGRGMFGAWLAALVLPLSFTRC